jgi:repressor LexA
MSKSLTDRQQRVIGAIQSWIRENGYPPTIRELGKQLGIKSLRGVTTHLDAIAKKGYLSRQRGARGIKLLLDAAAGAIDDAIKIPILGRIAAGQPLLAEGQVEGHLILDKAVVGKPALSGASHFALKVRGESMINAGILDGDFVIVRQQPDAENGQIVAVLIGDEATVKRLFKEQNAIRLQPEHPTMEPILLTKDQAFSILGRVVAVFRRLP